ncbi:MAG: fibronectin type III domain-containing protein [Patescibacteria group bacterium]
MSDSKSLLVKIGIGILGVSLGILSFCQIASAATFSVTGYAWSDTIGWIQFDPAFGGVQFNNTTFELSGYAWSDNIGWISFDATDANHPSAEVDMPSASLTGWIRACAGTINGDCNSASRTDGWDGWISLNCNNSGSGCAVSNYKVTVGPTGELDNWAWGSDVVGWIDFEGVVLGGFVSGLMVDLSVNPISGDAPLDTTLRADVASSMPGLPIDYYFWWDCSNVSSDLATVIAACGDPSNSSIGIQFLDQISDFKIVNHTYNNPGGYNPKVIAYQTIGFLDTDNESITVNSPSVPNDPTNLLASDASCEEIRLSWTDNSNNETEFRIERKTGAGAFGQIATVGANVTNYTDSTVVVANNYTYRMRACNGMGCSGYSNQAGPISPIACAGLQDFRIINVGDKPLLCTLRGSLGVTCSTVQLIIDIMGTSFNSDVALTSDISTVIPGATDVFSDSLLTSSEYNVGSSFTSNSIPNNTPRGLYYITVTGTGGGLIRTISIPLNLSSINRGWRQL